MSGVSFEPGKLFSGLADKMKKNKLVEIAVYGALALAVCVVLIWGGGDRTGEAGDATDVETRLEEALGYIDGAGKTKVMLTYSEDGETVIGAIVIAEGARDIAVRLDLQRAAMTALGLSLSEVEVFEMKKTTEGEG